MGPLNRRGMAFSQCLRALALSLALVGWMAAPALAATQQMSSNPEAGARHGDGDHGTGSMQSGGSHGNDNNEDKGHSAGSRHGDKHRDKKKAEGHGKGHRPSDNASDRENIVAVDEPPIPTDVPAGTTVLLSLSLAILLGAVGGWVLRVSTPS